MKYIITASITSLLALASCRKNESVTDRLVENSSEAAAVITHTGKIVVEDGVRLAEFSYQHESHKRYLCLDLTKLGDKYYNTLPRFEIHHTGDWKTIASEGCGTEPIIINPGKKFLFYAPLDPLEEFSKSDSIRILIGNIKSLPFQIDET